MSKKNETKPLKQPVVSSSASVVDEWTCGCLYKCNDCLKVESEGGHKREYFEKKDLDYWDE